MKMRMGDRREMLAIAEIEKKIIKLLQFPDYNPYYGYNRYNYQSSNSGMNQEVSNLLTIETTEGTVALPSNAVIPNSANNREPGALRQPSAVTNREQY